MMKMNDIGEVLKSFSREVKIFHTGVNILAEIPYFFLHLPLISSSFFSAEQ